MDRRWLAGGLALVLAACAGEQGATRDVREYARPAAVQGLSITGRAEFYPDGRLECGRLAQAATLGELRLPAGSILHLTPRGEPAWSFLPEDREIQGHLCQGGGDDWMTCFFPDGRLKSCGLARLETIGGIPCDKGTFWTETVGGGGRTSFHENGRLACARVARRVQVLGRELERGQHVRLDAAGRILSVD